MSLEGTLALAVKHYRTIVDSRRFIPLASEEEFKKVFDAVLCGLTDNLADTLCFEDESIRVDAKAMSTATDILKLLIILKHFINEPVYADETLYTIFEKAADKPKVSSAISEFDDHKAKKRFETFLVNLYVLLSEDEGLKPKANQFFKNLLPARLQVLLLEAAPRASQEEMYRKSYRKLLSEIVSINEIVAQIIKRLDSAYPEPQIIEGLERKSFLLDRLGWKQATVYQCAEQLHKNILDACKKQAISEALRNLEYFWILLDECKFVAVDEYCGTLFIFPSECESFIKASCVLHQCLNQVCALKLSPKDALRINEINKEISTFVYKLVRALSQNFIHFERDLNNRNSRSCNKLLAKVVLELNSLSTDIFDFLTDGPFESIEIAPSASNNKLVGEFVEKTSSLPNTSEESLILSEETTVVKGKKVPSPALVHSVIPITKSDDFESETKPKATVLFWTILALVLITLSLIFGLHSLFNKPNKN